MTDQGGVKEVVYPLRDEDYFSGDLDSFYCVPNEEIGIVLYDNPNLIKEDLPHSMLEDPTTTKSAHYPDREEISDSEAKGSLDTYTPGLLFLREILEERIPVIPESISRYPPREEPDFKLAQLGLIF